jgi:hypothetical protein
LNFKLVPFRENAPFTNITGQMERQSARLSISFTIPKTTAITWPNLASVSERKSGLWTSTCFECFIGKAGCDTYYECNVSPAGHWQVFRFNAYRQPPLTESELISVNRITNLEQSCGFSIDVHDPQFVTSEWRISPACVIEDASVLHYYADHHPNGQPDFHLESQRQYALS